MNTPIVFRNDWSFVIVLSAILVPLMIWGIRVAVQLKDPPKLIGVAVFLFIELFLILVMRYYKLTIDGPAVIYRGFWYGTRVFDIREVRRTKVRSGVDEEQRRTWAFRRLYILGERDKELAVINLYAFPRKATRFLLDHIAQNAQGVFPDKESVERTNKKATGLNFQGFGSLALSLLMYSLAFVLISVLIRAIVKWLH